MSNAKIKDRHRRDAEAALNEASSRYAFPGFISMCPIAQAIADAEERGRQEARHAPGVLKVAKILAQAETNALEVQDKLMQMLEILAGTVDMAITELEEGHSEVAKEILQGIFADLKRGLK